MYSKKSTQRGAAGVESFASTAESEVFNTKFRNPYDAAVAKKSNFEFAYRPMPVTAIPNSPYVTITPVGTFTPNRDDSNPLNDVLYRLPLQQTANSCIMNAAALKTNFAANEPAAMGGNFQSASKIQKYAVAELKKKTTQERATVQEKGTAKMAILEFSKIPGLHYRVCDRYMNNNIDIFKNPPDPSVFSINTTEVGFPLSGQYLPTNFADLKGATTTNFTNKSGFAMIQNNQAINVTGISIFQHAVYGPAGSDNSEFYDVADIIRPLISGESLNIPAQNYRDLFKITADMPSNSRLIILYSKSSPTPITIENNVNENGSYVRPNNERHQFAVYWEGIFTPHQSGTWQFYLRSDDDSFMWVDTETSSVTNNNTIQNATINNGGLHGMQERSNTNLRFIKDKKYQIKFHFAENWGGYNFVVKAIAPDGSVITDFKDLFSVVFPSFKETTKETSKDVETVKDVVSYETGDAIEKTVDLGTMYNKTFSTADPNPVYVSMVNTPETGLYDCYMTNPAQRGKIDKMNQILANAANVPIFNTVTMWKSGSQGDPNNGFTILNATPAIMIDGNIPISVIEAPTAERMTMPVPDEVHYVYIREQTGSGIIGGGNRYFYPHIYLYNATNKFLSKIDLPNNKEFNDNMQKYQAYQVQNLEWRHDTARCLAFDPAGNSANDPRLGVLYKITADAPVISVNQMFRLIMKHGYLTLEMSIDATQTTTEDARVKFVSKNLVNNTHSILKVDTSRELNQLNLHQKDNETTMFVPRNYTKYDTKYTQYKDMAPYIAEGEANTTMTKDECETECNKRGADCNSYYSYTEGGKTFCKMENTDKTDAHLSYFNTRPNRAIQRSDFYMKNRAIQDDYNKPTDLIDVVGNGVLSNTTTFRDKTYFPNAPEKNEIRDFDTIKYEIKERDRLMFQYLNDPANFKMSDLDATEAALKKKLAEDAAAAAALEKSTKAATDGFRNIREGFDEIAACSTADYKSNPACLSSKLLVQINTDYNKVKNKDATLVANYNNIKDRVAKLDQKFIAMSDPADSNLYKYDFNGFDDSQEKSIVGALNRDTNEVLLHQNSLYIFGTLTTASIVILAILLARSGGGGA